MSTDGRRAGVDRPRAPRRTGRLPHLHSWFGIGDTDIFDWGGLVGAIIGTLIVLPIAGSVMRRWTRGSAVC